MTDEGDSQVYLHRGGELRLSNRVQLEMMRAVLERGARFRFRATGGSMIPFIKTGDVLTVASLAESGLCPGQVVACQDSAGRRLVVHRLIKASRTREEVVIRGDNCSEVDGAISRKHVLGVVVRIERRGRDRRLGLGPEGRFIAAVSAGGWLVPAIRWMLLPRRVLRAILRRT